MNKPRLNQKHTTEHRHSMFKVSEDNQIFYGDTVNPDWEKHSFLHGRVQMEYMDLENRKHLETSVAVP